MENSSLSTLNHTVDNSTSPIAAPPGLPTILITFIVLQQLVFVLGCSGNSIVLIVFAKYIKIKSNLNIVYINMAIADFIQGLSSGIQILYFFFPSLTNNMYTCFLRYRLVSFPVFVSQCLVTMATFDRFFAIIFPHLYSKHMTVKLTRCLVALSYIISLLINITPFLEKRYWKEGLGCGKRFITCKIYFLLSANFLYTFMLMTMILYICILRKAFQYHRRLKKTDNEERNSVLRKNLRSARVLGITTLVFTLAWAPYEVYQYRYGLGKYWDFEFGLANWLVFFGISRCVANPFIYIWHRADFKQAVKMLFCYKEQSANKTEEANTTMTKT